LAQVDESVRIIQLEMIDSSLFMFTLLAMGQVCACWSLQGMQSENHDNQERVVVISGGAGFSEPISELPMSLSLGGKLVRRVDHNHETPLISGPADSVDSHKVTSVLLEVERGNSTSSTAIQTDSGKIDHLTPLGSRPKDSAETHKMTSAMLEISAAAGFSELPLSEFPMMSSEDEKLVRRVDHKNHTSFGSSPHVGAEAYKITSVLLDAAKANSTSSTATLIRSRDSLTTVFIAMLFLVLLAAIVGLSLMVMKSQRDVLALKKEVTPASRRAPISQPQLEDEAAVMIQKHYRSFKKSRGQAQMPVIYED